MKKQFAFIIICGMAVLDSCHQDPIPSPQPSNTTYWIPREVKDYCYFKEGSYWIYQDSATGQLDSVYVYYAANGLDTLHNQDYNGLYDWFDCKMMSSFDNYTYEHWYHATYMSTHPNRAMCYRDKYRPGDDAGETIIIDYPFVIGQNCYPVGSGTVTTVGFLDSMIVDQIFYHNVDILSQSDDATMNTGHSVYYLSKNIGIIRKEKPDSNIVWNLLRYQINQ